jgi:hypothetical protein
MMTIVRRSLLFGISIYAAFLINTADAAQYMNGDDLLRNCDGNGIRYGLCLGYVEGVVDDADMVRLKSGRPECVPPGVEAGQLVDIVVNYLRENPARRKVAAGFSITDAIGAAWGCKLSGAN